jgi:hypothetical protein
MPDPGGRAPLAPWDAAPPPVPRRRQEVVMRLTRHQPVYAFAFAAARGTGKIDIARLLDEESERRRSWRKPQYEGGGSPRRADAPLRARLRLA